MKNTFFRIRDESSHWPLEKWLKFRTIDLHTGGEPLRVILEGFPELKGNSVLDYRRYCMENLDHFRKILLFEPRGHADMYACLLVPPNDGEGDFGIIFMHNEGYSTMCGHAVIAISTLAAQMHWIDIKEGENHILIDAPCGRISSFVRVKNGGIQGVRFHNVPSFVVGLDRIIEVPGLGKVKYDIAFGGAFYAYVDMHKNSFDFDLSASSHQMLIEAGMQIKRAVAEKDKKLIHHFEADLSFLYGTIFIGDALNPGIDSRNVCIFANGEVDRSPTGSGVSGRMALHYHRNEISIGHQMRIESITNSVFKASVVKEVDFGAYRAVIPEIEGTAYLTGMHTFVVDPEDPFREGFILR